MSEGVWDDVWHDTMLEWFEDGYAYQLLRAEMRELELRMRAFRQAIWVTK